jgi:hypothetical protein
VQTVVETPTYLKAVNALFSEKDREEIVLAVAANPEAGDIMRRGFADLPHHRLRQIREG